MKIFMLKSILLAAIMFICVLVGMQQANMGIHNMRGYEDSNFKDALTVQENKSGEIHVSILGKDVDSHDLEQKKEKLEKMKTYNLFSSIGKKIASIFSIISEKVFILISDLMN